jgi:chromosome segregation ATPase
MNGNEPAKHPDLFDHEVRITRLEEAVKHIQQTLERIERELTEFRSEMRAEQRALRESLERQIEAMRQEFHRDRRFMAMIFLTTQLAVIGALLRLAGVL